MNLITLLEQKQQKDKEDEERRDLFERSQSINFENEHKMTITSVQYVAIILAFADFISDFVWALKVILAASGTLTPGRAAPRRAR